MLIIYTAVGVGLELLLHQRRGLIIVINIKLFFVTTIFQSEEANFLVLVYVFKNTFEISHELLIAISTASLSSKELLNVDVLIISLT